MMEQKLCKKCQRSLPEGYKYKLCENCRNIRMDNIKKGLKVLKGVGVGGGALGIPAIVVGIGKMIGKK